MNRAERLRVLLNVYGPAAYDPDPRTAAACLSVRDRAILSACDEEDRALLNACLELEAELIAREVAAAEKYCAVFSRGVPLSKGDACRAVRAADALGWFYEPPEVERVSD